MLLAQQHSPLRWNHKHPTPSQMSPAHLHNQQSFFRESIDSVYRGVLTQPQYMADTFQFAVLECVVMCYCAHAFFHEDVIVVDQNHC